LAPSSDERAIASYYYSSAIGGLIVLLSLVLLLPGIIYLAATARWRRAQELRVARHYEFSETGIRLVMPGSEGSIAWSMIATAEKSGPHILLATGQPLYYWIPSRCFTDESELQRFCQLVKSKVDRCRLPY